MPIAASSIAQQAFRHMQMAPLSSFADDSPQAADAAEQYPLALKSCLEEADWSFARKRAELPELASPPDAADPHLTHAFKLPADCVQVRYVPCARWRVDGRHILTDAPGPLFIRYTWAVTDEAKLPSRFQHAVSLELAFRLAPVWVKSDTDVERLERRAETALRRALQDDGPTASTTRYDGQPDSASDDWAVAATSWGSYAPPGGYG